MNKAEQEAKDRHEAWEKEQAAEGKIIHLPRTGATEKPDAAKAKKKPAGT
jgi:hypothetical protein